MQGFAGRFPPALLLLCLLPCPALSACDPLIGDATIVTRYRMELEGRERASRTLLLPAQANVGVVLQEQGLDAVLELRAGTNLVGRADGPISRSGTQRVLFRSQPGQVYTVDLVGKEPRGIRGRLDLYVVAIPTESACTRVHRTLARAEAQYAIGQSITNGVEVAVPGTADAAYLQSANAFSEVAVNLVAAGPAPILAQAQHAAAATFYDGVHDYPQAAQWGALASASYAEIGDDYGHARAEVVHAAALIELRDGTVAQASDVSHLQRARQLLQPVATFHAARGESYDQALAINYTGVSYYYDGLYRAAVEAYQQALTLHEQSGEDLRRIQVMGNLALVEYELGRLSSAIPRFAEALSLFTPSEQPTLYANILNNSALTNHAAGNIDTALQQYDQALQLARRIQDPFYEALSSYGLATIYAKLGESEQALHHHRKALALRSVDLDAAGRVDSLKAVANALRAAGQVVRAEALHRQALTLVHTPISSASLRIELARDLALRGEASFAEEELGAVLRQRSAGDTFVRACALLERGEQRIARRSVQSNAKDLHEALQIFTIYDAVDHQFSTLLALTRHALLIQQPQTALGFVDRALTLAETLRLHSANVEFRAQLLQRLRPAFDLKIALLADRYFSSSDANERQRLADLILDTAERARARALVDFARLDMNARQLPGAVLQRREQLYQELAARNLRLTVAAEDYRSDRPLLAGIRADIAELRRELDRVEAQVARQPRPPATGRNVSLRRQRNTLPGTTAVIEYWLGEHQALAWTVTQDATTITKLGPTSEILARAGEFTATLRGLGTIPHAERLRASSALAQLIWQPLEAGVAGKQTLVFIPDQALHYVPFAALRRKSNEFLIQAHDVATTPSLGTLLRGLNSQRKHDNKRLLLVDDPVFSNGDPRLAGGRSLVPPSQPYAMRSGERSRPLVRLPATAQEAAAIARLLPAERVVRLEGFAATKELFLKSDLADFSYIHLATHAAVDEQIPQLSALMLTSVNAQGRGIDGRVLAADLMSVRLNAELVVLSACDTALGKQVGGEGLIGLRYVALARGARAVASSLWPVPDSIAELQMKHLYAALFGQGSTPVQASSEAMRSLLKARLGDPALWAAFELTIGGMDSLVVTDNSSRK